MARAGLPPRFSPWKAPKPRRMAQRQEAGRWRISPRKRGYDQDWDELSRWYRRRNPFCRFCEQEGRVGLTAVVDHILPAHEFPELRRDTSNFQPLCHHHHNTTKARLETYARKYGLLEQLPFWCEAIENRPPQFRPLGY